MSTRPLHYGIFSLCSLCLCGSILFLFFYRLADRDLWSSHEARAAPNAQSILDSGAWTLPPGPTFQGRLVLVPGRLSGGGGSCVVERSNWGHLARGCRHRPSRRPGGIKPPAHHGSFLFELCIKTGA